MLYNIIKKIFISRLQNISLRRLQNLLLYNGIIYNFTHLKRVEQKYIKVIHSFAEQV